MTNRTSRLWLLSILLCVMGTVPNAALGTSGQGGLCPTGGDDCTAVPHNENFSWIDWDLGLIGSWSIGRCEGWDACKCNNGAEKAVIGVAMVPKGSGSGQAVFVCEDKDYYFWENGNDGFCAKVGMEHGSNGDGDFSDPIDFSVPGTTPLVGLSFELTNEPAFHCPPPAPSPWRGEPTEAAEAYVHVYEVELEATPQGNGANISWSITQFTGSASGDVTPNHLMLTVTNGANEAVGGPYHGWSGSENWDGNWAGGGSWNGCGQVTISLGVAPDPPTARWGVSSIYATDESCGVWAYFNHSPGKSILFPEDDECECGDEVSGLSGCPATWKKTCKTGNSTTTYNCYAWSVNRTDIWVEPVWHTYPPPSNRFIVDFEYGNGDGQISQAEWDAFYADHGLVPTAPCTDACAGWNEVHAYNLCSCSPLWESKCADGERGTHGVQPLPGNYGWPSRYYKPSSE